MLKRPRLIAAAAVTGALAAAGPVASASAAQTAAVAPVPTAGSSIPCYPLPAYCANDGQPAWWAPQWVRLALGYPPTLPWRPITPGPVMTILPVG
jgi:hypothetical protein